MRIVLADDSMLIRAGIREILTSHSHEVIRECEDATELVAAVDEFARSGAAPDLVITDVRMPRETPTTDSAPPSTCDHAIGICRFSSFPPTSPDRTSKSC